MGAVAGGVEVGGETVGEALGEAAGGDRAGGFEGDAGEAVGVAAGEAAGVGGGGELSSLGEGAGALSDRTTWKSDTQKTKMESRTSLCIMIGDLKVSVET